VPQVAPVVGVLHNSGRHEGVGGLEEHGGAAAQEGDDQRVANPGGPRCWARSNPRDSPSFPGECEVSATRH
jgi:hypothetical protein